jgi:hypothetical protein
VLSAQLKLCGAKQHKESHHKKRQQKAMAEQHKNMRGIERCAGCHKAETPENMAD